jgi:hypothetical protein
VVCSIIEKKQVVTFAWFQRGRGVATGLSNPSRVAQINKIINDMPSYERGAEYRAMTREEEDLAKQDALVAAARPPSKKRKRQTSALAPDAAAAAAQAENSDEKRRRG